MAAVHGDPEEARRYCRALPHQRPLIAVVARLSYANIEPQQAKAVLLPLSCSAVVLTCSCTAERRWNKLSMPLV